LVSLVAALGLTVPSAPVIESWVASTQNWMNARFADWDTRSPQSGDYVIVSDFYDAMRFAPRPALNLQNGPIILTPPLVTQKPPATTRFDPAPAVDDLTPQFQQMLVEWRGALLSLLAATLQQTTAPRFNEPGNVSKKTRGFATEKVIQLCQGIGINPVIVPPQGPAVAASRRAAVTPTHSLASPSSFGPMEKGASLYFAGELRPWTTNTPIGGAGDSKQAPATPVASRPSLAELAEALESQHDLNLEMVGELQQLDDGFGTPPIAILAPVRLTTPEFIPIEAEGDRKVGIAYELNSLNDGLSTPEEHAFRTTRNDLSAPQSSREISRAMRLTRDAVYAWVNVFTGPALVTVSRSN
jgi:hypothetical protein